MAITISGPPGRGPGARGALPPLPPLPPLPLLLLLLLPTARGADWSIAPTLRLRESYSDNIALAPPGQNHAGLISEVAPGLVLAARGPRLDLQLAYSLARLSNTRQPDATSHQLSAEARAQLLEDWLFLDARSSISERNVSAFGPQLADQLHRTPNQSSVGSTSLSPYLRHRWIGLAGAELRYTHTRIDSDSALLGSRADQVQCELTGERPAGSWNWRAHYERRRGEDGSRAPQVSQRATLTLSYPVSASLGLFGTIGHEAQGYRDEQAGQGVAGESPQGRSWSLGAGWYPSARTSLVVSGGKRFFGNTYSADATYRSRQTSWSFGYHEDITSTPQELSRLSSGGTAALLDQLWSASMPDPVLRQQRIAAFVGYARYLGPEAGAVNYFTQRYFLQKQWRLSTVRVSQKSTLSFDLSATGRTAQTTSGIDSALLPPLQTLLEERTRQRGANAGWSWRASARTNLNLATSYAANDSISAGRRDRNLALSAGISRALRHKVSAALDLRRMRHSSNMGGGYRENGISATLVFQL
ncbi:MAG: TIGR03016 family PEP-CTERM system-associated outer membrane protein [Pseudomonadota bacterium]